MVVRCGKCRVLSRVMRVCDARVWLPENLRLSFSSYNSFLRPSGLSLWHPSEEVFNCLYAILFSVMVPQEPTLRVRINQIDYTVVQPGALDNSVLPKVPVIRIYGGFSKGTKTCVHIHQVYPYFFVEYTGKITPSIGPLEPSRPAVPLLTYFKSPVTSQNLLNP